MTRNTSERLVGEYLVDILIGGVGPPSPACSKPGSSNLLNLRRFSDRFWTSRNGGRASMSTVTTRTNISFPSLAPDFTTSTKTTPVESRGIQIPSAISNPKWKGNWSLLNH